MTKEKLIQSLIKEGYLKTPRIIKAFHSIDRIDFIPEDLKKCAYFNEPLPIGEGQTISQPLTVAFMLELLNPRPGDKILEIGSGSGWQAALLGNIVGEKGKVFTLEIIKDLAKIAEQNISKYNFLEKRTVKVSRKDGFTGYATYAPYDKIIAAAAAEKISPQWKKQLKVNGILVAPVRNSVIRLIKKSSNGDFEKHEFYGFKFVPLTRN